MSFFVSDSLKNIISEEDLAADSPIKIIEEKEFVKLQLCNDILNKTIFEAELVKAEFGTKLDSIVVMVDIKDLKNIFMSHNQNLEYSLFIHGNQYMQNRGILVLNKIEVNKEDNYITCKIDIFKRS